MKTIEMKFYNKVHPKLKNYISHYWSTAGMLEEDEKMQLLPMDHIDITVPVKGLFTYQMEDQVMAIDHNIIHSLRDRLILVQQKGFVEAFGITFTPWGFYALVGKSIDRFTNRIVPLADHLPHLDRTIKEGLAQGKSKEDLIHNMEASILANIKTTKHYEESIWIIESFLKDPHSSIADFCQDTGIQRKSLERIFRKYIGTSPKKYLSILQFEESSRAILFNESVDLTRLTCDQAYYDQAHFTKTFKKYTNLTPSDFKKENPALKSKIKYD